MGDYIGDKKKKGSSGSSSGGDTKQFTAVRDVKKTGSSSGAKGSSSKGGSSKSGSGSSRSQSSSSKGTSQKSGGSKNSSASRQGNSANGTTQRIPSQKPASSKNTSSKGTSSSGKKPSSQSSAGKGTSSQRSTGGQKSAYSGQKPSSAKRPSSQSSQSQKKKNSKSAYSESLEKKRGSSYERELHASQRAAEIKKARKRRTYNRYRKLINFMFYAAIFVAVTAVIVIMSVTVLFGIEDIVVEAGDGVPYTSNQIVSACDVREGQNLFTAPIEDASEQIMTSLPYIEECTVNRRLPSTVIITVSGAKAIGVVIDETGQRVIVSSGMRVLENVVSAGDAPGIPVIEGVVVSDTSVGGVVESREMPYIEAAAEIVRILDSQGLKLDSISFSSGGNITAVYDGRINLVLGTATDLENKLLLAAMLINDGKITRHESGDLNLSIDGKAIFTPDYVKQQHDKGDE